MKELAEPEDGLSPEVKANWVRDNDERLMDWIQNKVRPVVLAGFELELCYQQLKQAVSRLPKLKPIPVARPPRTPLFQHQPYPEANLSLSAATLRVIPAPKPVPRQPVVEEAVNKFVDMSETDPKFSFYSKQRFKDMQALVSKYHGKSLTEAVIRMPENEPEETYVPPEPAFAGIPLTAFEEEGFIFQPLPQLFSRQEPRPEFITKFYIPDLKTMKTTIAKHQRTEGPDPYKPVSDHQFRDEDRPRDYGKPEFRLRVQTEIPPPLLLHAESAVQTNARKKQDLVRKKSEEQLKRTFVGGKTRGEWAASKHTNPKALQFASGEPHWLLPKEPYVDSFYVMARAYNF